MEFSSQEYWSGLSFPTPGNLLDSEIKPISPSSPALADEFLTTEPPGEPIDVEAPTNWGWAGALTGGGPSKEWKQTLHQGSTSDFKGQGVWLMGWMLRVRWKDPVKGRLWDSIGRQFTAPRMRAGPPACSSQTVRVPGCCWETSGGFPGQQPLQVQAVAGDSGLFMTHWEQREVTTVYQGLPCYLDAAEIQSQGLCSFAWGNEREVRGSPSHSR